MWGPLLAIVFWADVLVPDPVPYLDEVVLFLMAFKLNVSNKAVFWTTMTALGAVVEWFIKLP